MTTISNFMSAVRTLGFRLQPRCLLEYCSFLAPHDLDVLCGFMCGDTAPNIRVSALGRTRRQAALERCAFIGADHARSTL